MNGWTGTRNGMPEVGATASITKRLGAHEVALFAEISGDHNPLHFDREVAQASRFGGLITHGGVTSGLLNAVVAEHLPGPGTVFLSTSWNFRRPTYFDEEMTATVTVSTVREDKPICTLATTVTNADGEVCIDGEAVTYTAPLDQDS
ncbi:MaoC family dehydratase [Phycicoccus sp. DTK01]|uniref:MaoC family dehydratase n=1 Tax=Phycicoccus sp. DTK01 TaxID=2785745 RepID=UPI001A8BF8C4|nr:MaoC family dehydratase [Phycicoccus sp. DTK01]GIL36722.1 hypothetical protein PDTK01_27970 [Phycicoccus sp. DTK01]